ncbi:MAG TPA: universal stress protein [Burkholderiaceae bacterium]|nr:universal stress protein [Burkholderiaceae bacterium]
MFEKILVAYDGSESAGHAFDLACDVAKKYEAVVRVIAVVRPPEFGEEVETEAVLEHSMQHYRDVLQPLHERAKAAALTAEFDVIVGHPAERIIVDAEKWGAKLIVLGHLGRGLVGRWLIGSVAKQVMHHAPCAVLVTR